MTKDEYNSLSEELKLDARLAITLGHDFEIYKNMVLLKTVYSIYHPEFRFTFSEYCPRQDPAILWGLIGDYAEIAKLSNGDYLCSAGSYRHCHQSKTKEEAVIKAYCEADPNGHWAKWCKDNEVTV